MTLLEETISALASSDSRITDALLKTKVLLHQLGRRDLAEWVNHELNGYPENSRLPDYRIFSAAIRGCVSNGVYRVENTSLPTLHLGKEIRDRLENVRMRQSISGIEMLAANDKHGMTCPMQIEYTALFNKALSNGYRVESAWVEVGPGKLGEVLTQVRSRLLDFLLDLSERTASTIDEDQLRRIGASPEVSAMFQNAVFGDHTTLIFGSGNSVTVISTINEGDFESLRRALNEQGVADSDVDGLKKALRADDETRGPTEKSIGPNVNAWIESMLDKARSSVWQIQLGVASNFLFEAIKKFLGG